LDPPTTECGALVDKRLTVNRAESAIPAGISEQLERLLEVLRRETVSSLAALLA
jgi:hypothetical protein